MLKPPEVDISRRSAEHKLKRYVESPQRPITIAPSICHLYTYTSPPHNFHKAAAQSIEEANTQLPLILTDALLVGHTRKMHLQFSFYLLWSSFVVGCAYAANDISVLINEVAKANNQSLLWGPYKPNLYFGVRPRIPKSLTAGLMWAKVDNYATAQASMFSYLFC